VDIIAGVRGALQEGVRLGSTSDFRRFWLTSLEASTNFSRVVKVFILVVPNFIIGAARSALRANAVNQKP
jgi:hypothetical protein